MWPNFFCFDLKNKLPQKYFEKGLENQCYKELELYIVISYFFVLVLIISFLFLFYLFFMLIREGIISNRIEWREKIHMMTNLIYQWSIVDPKFMLFHSASLLHIHVLHFSFYCYFLIYLFFKILWLIICAYFTC